MNPQNKDIKLHSTTEATEILKGNILLSEFMEAVFFPALNNAVIGVSFSTYSECLFWIEQHDEAKGMAPTVMLGYGCGIYDKDWNWLIRAWRKVYRCVLEKHYQNNTYMERFKIFEHNFHAAIDVNSARDGFDQIVNAVTWYNEITK